MQYYNIHTHFPTSHEQVTAIVNRYWGGTAAATDMYSAGLHPWYLDQEKMVAAAKWLEEQAAAPQCVAIGEAGLDRAAGADWNIQVAAFETCVERAIALQKPLILHCVRAFDEVLAVKRRFGKPADQIPWIFHGFNKKTDIARRMLDAGTYLSFGAALLESKFPAASSLQMCPADGIYLETDDRSDITIQEIYTAAAAIRGTTIEEISQQIENNFQKIFF